MPHSEKKGESYTAQPVRIGALAVANRKAIASRFLGSELAETVTENIEAWIETACILQQRLKELKSGNLPSEFNGWSKERISALADRIKKMLEKLWFACDAACGIGLEGSLFYFNYN